MSKTPIVNRYVALLSEAYAQKCSPAERAYGCGRAYVCVFGLDKKEMRLLAKAAEQLGFLFQTTGYQVANALYVGYDNADGRALARAEVIANYLTAKGVQAYVEAVSD